MFKSARLRLTGLYCGIFFTIFWLFSLGIYYLMSTSFGDSYVSKVTQTQSQQHGSHSDVNSPDTTAETAVIAGSITESQLIQVLLILNGVLILVVPSAAWLLTGRTLQPVYLAYQRQKRFVSDASHELRTPLTIMRGELELALKRRRTNLEYESALTTTHQEVIRLQRLVDTLLMLASADQPALLFDREPVDIKGVLQEVKTRLEGVAALKRIDLALELSLSKAFVPGSSDMLGQLFENLCTNAIKYSDSDSTVTIALAQVGKTVSTKIIDQGVGMSAQTQEQAFERFYRADEARRSVGIGLGLSICKTIVEHHHGQITIDSQLGVGTTVTVELPVA